MTGGGDGGGRENISYDLGGLILRKFCLMQSSLTMKGINLITATLRGVFSVMTPNNI